VLGTFLFAALLVAQASPAPSPRAPAEVVAPRSASWLEREGREHEQRPQEIFKAMSLKDGDVVADVGCGSGWFSRRLARAVAPRGKVYAEDIQQGMLDLAGESARKEGLDNVEIVLGTETDPRLPEGGVDWVLLVDVYHEFQKPAEMLEAIRRSLKPGGRVALIEYRLEGTTASHIRAAHRMSKDQVLREWVPAGFRLVEQLEFLPTQHFFVLAKEP
jgi:ubiquinone/menaquinone biosynthesis C-methylase UbiE